MILGRCRNDKIIEVARTREIGDGKVFGKHLVIQTATLNSINFFF